MRKSDEFNIILDSCAERVSRGEDIQSCLADYPRYADELRPLLQAIGHVRRAGSFTPSAGAKAASRQRFNAALAASGGRAARRARAPVLKWSLSFVAAAGVVALLAFGLSQLLSLDRPGSSPTLVWPGNTSTATPSTTPPGTSTPWSTSTPSPAPSGYLVMMLSDEVNAIADFESLVVSISSIGFHMTDGRGGWVEVAPQTGEADLTLLQGDRALRLWEGEAPQGRYDKVFIYVSGVTGILKESGLQADVRLPGSKIEIPLPFEVKKGEVTTFVYDITAIIRPGNSGKYILKPQPDQSGPDKAFQDIAPRDKPGQP